MAAINVVADTDTADTQAPAVPERCILIKMDGLGGGRHYESHLLMGRVQGTRFVTLDTAMVLLVEDLATEEIIPITGGQTYPVAGMPLVAFGVLTEAVLGPLRARARQLLEIHGGALPPSVSAQGASWRADDTAHPRSGEAIAPEVLAVPGYLEVRGSYALAFVDGSWVSAEQVLDLEAPVWKTEKRSGAGRDPRLLPFSVSEKGTGDSTAAGWTLETFIRSTVAGVVWGNSAAAVAWSRPADAFCILVEAALSDTTATETSRRTSCSSVVIMRSSATLGCSSAAPVSSFCWGAATFGSAALRKAAKLGTVWRVREATGWL